MKHILTTERLYFRELTLEDKCDLAKILSDEESMQYYPHPFSDREVEGWIQWNLKNYTEYGFGLWAVILKKDDSFLGDCGITMQTIEGERIPEIGYHIKKRYWNQGFATEAAIVCKAYAFEVLGFEKVYTYTTVRNTPSRRIAEKNGMTIERYFEKNNEHQVLYSCCKGAY
jgi:RimJ/RimL family protein N-acetyltransferase